MSLPGAIITVVLVLVALALLQQNGVDVTGFIGAAIDHTSTAIDHIRDWIDDVPHQRAT